MENSRMGRWLRMMLEMKQSPIRLVRYQISPWTLTPKNYFFYGSSDGDWSENKSSRTVRACLGPVRIAPSSRHVNERCWLVLQVLFTPKQTLPKRILFLCFILASRTSCYVWTHGSHHWQWMIFCLLLWQLWPWSTTSLFWDLVPSIL